MIPLTLHRTVPADTTDQVEAWWQTAQEHHPKWSHVTWRDPLDPIKFPRTSEHWARCGTGAQRAGLIRLEVLWHYGGIYIDSDVEVLRPFDELTRLEGFAAWEDHQCIPDAVLGFRPRHPAVDLMLSYAVDRIDIGAWASGPGVTTEVLSARPDVLVLPPGAFYPVHYTEKQLCATDARRDAPWVFAVHHWAGSWLPTT